MELFSCNMEYILKMTSKIIAEENSELLNKVNFYQKSLLQKSTELKALQQKYKVVLYEKNKLEIKNKKLSEENMSIREDIRGSDRV